MKCVHAYIVAADKAKQKEDETDQPASTKRLNKKHLFDFMSKEQELESIKKRSKEQELELIKKIMYFRKNLKKSRF